jgi:hypothetical protein
MFRRGPGSPRRGRSHDAIGQWPLNDLLTGQVTGQRIESSHMAVITSRPRLHGFQIAVFSSREIRMPVAIRVTERDFIAEHHRSPFVELRR